MNAVADRYVLSDPVRRRLRRLSRAERGEEAAAFIRQFARETGMAARAERSRIGEVRAAIRRTGHYDHHPAELEFGARLAWRNHARCIGRLTWKSLQVHDCRDASAPEEVMRRTIDSVERAFAGGRIASAITIFAPATETSLPTVFESPQILQYAGYASEHGVIGDRANIELTRTAQQLGWQAPDPPGMFDLLPVILRDPAGARHAFALPRDFAREVAIAHPRHPAVAALGLRWYAVPVVSNMVLTIGGIDYPCAPFNGHYMATEIASRNLIDDKRFALLEPFARAIGLDPDGPATTLWRDEALTELNRAVLASFAAAGVTIVDHHGASADYMTFVQLEQRAGRTPWGEWSWIVPPQASAACPTFHLPMTDGQAVPNFYYGRHIDGGMLAIDRSHRRDGVWQARYQRLKRRWRDWRRRRDHIWQR